MRWRPTTRASPGHGIRVATLNVWGRAANWPQRLARLIECWPRIDADVLLLQEAQHDLAGSQADEIADVLGFGSVVTVYANVIGGRQEGLALLSRLPVERSYGWPLPTSAPVRRALVAEIAVADVLITVTNAHAVFMPTQTRDAQIAALLSRAERPLVVAGDLNATPAELSSMLEESDLCDPHDGLHAPATWPVSERTFVEGWVRMTGKPPRFRLDPKRIDYLLTGGLQVRAAGTDPLRAQDGGHASDHATVWADYLLWVRSRT